MSRAFNFANTISELIEHLENQLSLVLTQIPQDYRYEPSKDELDAIEIFINDILRFSESMNSPRPNWSGLGKVKHYLKALRRMYLPPTEIVDIEERKSGIFSPSTN